MRATHGHIGGHVQGGQLRKSHHAHFADGDLPHPHSTRDRSMTAPEWTVPGYTEVSELGTGSQGRVVLAQRDDDDEFVAIKYLEPGLLQDTEEAEAFRREAEMLAQLDDPNVAHLINYAESDNGAAIVMEPITGVTLRKIL